MVNALFQQDNDIYIPTEMTTGPWGPDRLHGGAIAGLLGYALENASTREELAFARPVPLGPLKVETNVVRDGNRLEVLEATILANDAPVAKGSLLKIKPTQIEVPEHGVPSACAIAHPDDVEVLTISGDRIDRPLPPNFLKNIEIKCISGFQGSGSGQAWFRLLLPLIEGKENSPFVRLASICDFGNGLAQLKPINSGGSINADITLYLHRIPSSDWIGLDSKSIMQEQGIGLVNTQLYDPQGLIGTISQAIMPQPMR